MNDESSSSGANDTPVDQDKFLYHIGNLERLTKEREGINKRIQKARKQASADGVVMQTYSQALKIAKLAPETNTEEYQRLKEYLQFMNQPLGYQLTIDDVVKASDSAKGTAFKEGRAAGIKGYSATENPYDDPASPEGQSWLDGYGDGGKRRAQIEAGDGDEEQQEAA